jgi:hypothetical protein
MPARNERLLWIHGRALEPTAADTVDSECAEMLRAWSGPDIDYRITVQADGTSDRLWLFRLRNGDQAHATELNRRLKACIEKLKPLPLKRQVNLPTPLVATPFGSGHKLDIGLHAVNDPWNAALMFFFYYEGRYYNPPHLQLRDMQAFQEEAARLWRDAACGCRQGRHCPDGCWECFLPSCERCCGTGWKAFASWMKGGARIDYSTGWPLAVIPAV